MKGKIIHKIILVISFIGILISGYLTYTHFTAVGGEVCGIGNNGSCSIVNTSKYSQIFGIPAGVFGMVWFLALLFLNKQVQRKAKFARELFSWTVLGIVFVSYFIFAEIKLSTICFYCTIVHILVVISFILSFYLYKKS